MFLGKVEGDLPKKVENRGKWLWRGGKEGTGVSDCGPTAFSILL
jgi:hypothetical protein